MDFIQKAIDRAREQRGHSAPNENRAKPSVIADSPATQDIEYTKTRVVDVSPARLRQHRVIAGLQDDQRAESYRQLRTQILHQLRENNWRTLAITSPNSQAGKSLTALNLAISLSLEVNQTVLLVDLDLRHASLMDKLGIEAEYGLIDYLEGRVALSDVLINPGFERLVILPSRPQKHYRSEILSSPRMQELLRDIVNRYPNRIIIFDLPALLDDDDALVFTPYADTTLLVVEDGVSQRADIERSLQLLSGTRLLGTILNKVRD